MTKHYFTWTQVSDYFLSWTSNFQATNFGGAGIFGLEPARCFFLFPVLIASC